jgi:hypothetical protein
VIKTINRLTELKQFTSVNKGSAGKLLATAVKKADSVPGKQTVAE